MKLKTSYYDKVFRYKCIDCQHNSNSYLIAEHPFKLGQVLGC